MTKWDIDYDLRALEPVSAPGTTITRVLVSTNLITDPKYKAYGMRHLKLTAEEKKAGESIRVWALAIGPVYAPKAFFHGRTIRECYLLARKAVKINRGDLRSLIPWGQQEWELPKKKPREKKKKAVRKTS